MGPRLPPDEKKFQQIQLLTVQVAGSLHPAPAFLAVPGHFRVGHVHESVVFLPRPIKPTQFLQPDRELVVHLEQVADIVEGVAPLRRRERAGSPFGEGFRLVKPVPQHRLHDRRHARGKTHSQKSGGNLQVDQVTRGTSSPLPAQAHLLATAMNHHCFGRVGHDLPKSSDILQGDRINQVKGVASGHLNQAEDWDIGVFPDEFRVKREMVNAFQLRDQR